MTRPLRNAGLAGLLFLLVMGLLYVFVPHGAGDVEKQIGLGLPVVAVIPFVLMLLGIALIPLAAPHWWEPNGNKAIFAAAVSLPMLAYFLGFVDRGGEALLLLSHEYYAFIVLLATLFTVSGGIHLEGDIAATPKANTAFLAIGAVLASFIGTTGAAMLLVRPLLQTNAERRNKKHIFIFLTFIVANIGGLLTPLGDPPLFLGFLRGVPFSWTFNLWLEWLIANAILLSLFYVWDTVAYRKERPADIRRDTVEIRPLRLRGSHNFLLLGGVIASIVVLQPNLLGKLFDEHTASLLAWAREPIMILIAICSWLLDKRYEAGRKGAADLSPRESNRFTFHAIIEVAVLFAGIFITMLPALCLLKARGGELGVSQPWQFFWMAGSLSSFLDNAPTYLTFFSLAQGLADSQGLCAAAGACISGVPVDILAAISCGAVFMGANTYIGNAPNFMVKSIVDEAGVPMPSFLGYMLWSGGILLPIFVVLTFLFFV